MWTGVLIHHHTWIPRSSRNFLKHDWLSSSKWLSCSNIPVKILLWVLLFSQFNFFYLAHMSVRYQSTNHWCNICSQSSTHQVGCWRVNITFWCIYIVQQSQIQTFITLVGFLEQSLDGFHSAFSKAIESRLAWTLKYLF